MVTPDDPDGPVLDLDDTIDIPIVVRTAPDMRRASAWHKAQEPWPTMGTVPPVGLYLANTTWREVMDAAMTVGRDLHPWLSHHHERAGQELMARVAPLQAYLTRADASTDGRAGRRLVPSLAYTQGAERSARGAFSYRLGMTMAEWACRRLMDLGPTTHAESAAPFGVAEWFGPGRRPDLFGFHSQDNRTWLVEAKAARRIGLRQLQEGEKQLREGGALLSGHPHRLVLCGASIQDEVFVTVDDIDTGMPGDMAAPLPPVPGGLQPWEDRAGEDAEALLEVARSRMLIYFHLRYGPASRLQVVPIAQEGRSGETGRDGGLQLLERDNATTLLRERLRKEPPANAEELLRRHGVQGMITAPLYGTGMTVGMSPRLFAACARLHEEQQRIVEETHSDGAELRMDIDGHQRPQPRSGPAQTDKRLADRVPEGPGMDAERNALDDRIRRYRVRESEQRDVLRDAVCEAYDATEDERPSARPEIESATEPRPGERLEATTAETYIAVSMNDPVLGTDRR